jgi:deazaflavin-dependent oxidoreductase (nitroreductase family)
MPLPQSLARVNRKLTNRITRRFAGRIPPFAMIGHVGRKSGKVYRTPIMVFRSGSTFAIALTYGPDTEWVRNVKQAGTCTLDYFGRRFTLNEPRIVPIAEAPGIPLPVRLVLKIINAQSVLLLRQSDQA